MTWVEIAPPSFSTIRVSRKSACLEQSRELQAEDATVSAAEIDLERVLQNILGGAGTLSPRELKALPGLIFNPSVAPYHPEFAEKVLGLGGKSKGFWRRLLWAWKFHYEPETKLGKLVRLALKRNVHLLNEEQNALCDRIGLFESSLDKMALYEGIVVQRDESLAEEVGIADGYARLSVGSAVIELLAKKTAELASPAALKGFSELFAPGGEIHSSAESQALVGIVQCAKALPPDSSLVGECADIINQTFGDPRLNEARYPEVSAFLGGESVRRDCIATVRRWNVFKSINVFFEIIEETTTGDGHSHQFPKRKDFWLSYFQQNAVSEAWVLLGKKASAYMRRLKQEGDTDIASLQHGKLIGGSNEQSVLIMRVGDVTVVEWSHDGACRVWSSTDRRAPNLYQPVTERHELMNDTPARITHDHRGNWEAKLHSALRQKGNVRRRL
ncbi:EH signature domain-containing protein [Luminiphilus sp.]|nr:EH signature domain-containing protein [Luminiphilus sp.]